MTDEDAGKGIWQQFNEWLGRRHRVYYFITGLALGVAMFWYAFVPAILTQVNPLENQPKL